MIERVVSGGQTGVDRGALDAALALGLACGGWCPRGRRAEDGVIDARYPLKETTSRAYSERTEWNVRDSDGTLIITPGPLRGGTALTRRLARRYRRPCLVIDLDDDDATSRVLAWLDENEIRVLNVAGPRESQAPGMQQRVTTFLQSCLGGRP